MNQFLTAVSFAVLMSACSAPDDPAGETPPEREPDAVEAEQRPSAGEEADFDSLESVRRERLREAMTQHRQEALEDDQMVNRRERLRDLRSLRAAWWEDETLIADLALSDEQIEALREADEIRQQARIKVRQELAAARRDSSGTTGDSEAQADQRGKIQQQLQKAEDDWQRTVVAILDDDQLQQLDELYPHALGRSP